MDMNQYLDVFVEESREHLQAINEHMLKLENDPAEISIVNDIFRSAHTLKGMSATMGFEDLASLTHQMENVLDAIRQRKVQVTDEVIDALFESVDHLEAMVESIIAGGDGKRDVKDIVDKLNAIEKGKKQTPRTIDSKNGISGDGLDEFQRSILDQSVEQGLNPFTVKVTLEKSCILKAARVYMIFNVIEQLAEVIHSAPEVSDLEEEKFDHEFTVTLISEKEAIEIKEKISKVSEVEDVQVESYHTKSSPKESVEVAATMELEKSQEKKAENKGQNEPSVKSAQNNKTIRVNINRLDHLMNLFEELVVDRGRLEALARQLNNGDLTDTVEHMTRLSSDLQDALLTMRMVPIDQVFNRFPRMIRSLAKDLGKKINLEISGGETELDRTVIDEIGDPLVHLLRNSVDHGIELPERRSQAGKTEEGTISLVSFHSGNHIFIEIEDDGGGINREKVIQKAIENNIIDEVYAKTMEDHEVFQLLFASGFSTADTVSDISGRGVGLDVVKNKIESLGGQITVTSVRGRGTKFAIELPLTLSILSAMLITTGPETYAIPLSNIVESIVIPKSEVMKAHNQLVIDFRGKVVPLLSLREVLEVEGEPEEKDTYSIVVVRKGDQYAALIVDRFIGQQEIVLKPLGEYLSNIFAISGATILGDGKVSLILDCNDLIK
ncbi:chemotaxis protein CheA [Pseudalkalibacillus salsuginis]|uniref:chemotaxis protein CheA n=1 Tax=Pseudalkalibacillus salsuginis TaxID=2910972 RepID=UPI001F25E680|nr:chemotaxis protein CheA [Pseudalkalibacillus salsuginis]MCF6410588.1 chemotaxis protein CheA [Pseudalkalibacillus salsuginis]